MSGFCQTKMHNEELCNQPLYKNGNKCIFHAEEKDTTTFSEALKQYIESATEKPELDCSGFIFPADFNDYIIKNNSNKPIVFYEALFKGPAYFWGTKFQGEVDFRGVKFEGVAYFGHTQYQGETSFSGADFKEEAIFESAYFADETYFLETEFQGQVDFEDAEFTQDIQFGGSEFAKNVYFTNTKFLGRVGFSVEFKRKAYFVSTIFKDECDFRYLGNVKNAQIVFRDTNLKNVSFLHTNVTENFSFRNVTWNKELVHSHC